jgi:HEAT repeat protein
LLTLGLASAALTLAGLDHLSERLSCASCGEWLLGHDPLARLRSGLPRERSQAVRCLMRAGLSAEEGEAAVFPLLRDEEPRVRRVALEYVGRRYPGPDERSLEALLEVCGDPDRAVNDAVARAIGRNGSSLTVFPRLLRMLEGGDLPHRRCAALAMGMLVAHNPESRGTVAASAPALGRALASDDPGLRYAASWSLCQLGTEATPAVSALIGALGDPAAGTAGLAADSLGKVGAAAVPPLIEQLRAEDPKRRKLAVEALGEAGGAPAADALVALLSDEDREVRWAARRAVEEVGAAALPSLLECIQSGAPGWEEGLEILSEWRTALPPQAKPVLRQLMENHPVRSLVWQSAATALSYERSFLEALPVLTQMLEHPNPVIRVQAVLRLGSHGAGARAALPLLEERLEDPDGPVRCYTAVAIAGVDPTRVSDLIWFVADQTGLDREEREVQVDCLKHLAARRPAGEESLWWVVPAFHRWELLGVVLLSCMWFALAARFPRRRLSHVALRGLQFGVVAGAPTLFWVGAIVYGSKGWAKPILADARLTLVPLPLAASLTLSFVCVLATLWVLRRAEEEAPAQPQGPEDDSG